MIKELTDIREGKLKSLYKVMQALLFLWQNDPEIDKRSISRLFYDPAFKIPSGYRSQASMPEGVKTTPDHCFSPCFLGYMVMDMPEVFLNDYTEFREFSIFAATTIIVTPKENSILSNQSGNTVLDITCSIKDKYAEANIRLFKEEDGYINGDFPIPIRPDVLEYEKQYLTSN